MNNGEPNAKEQGADCPSVEVVFPELVVGREAELESEDNGRYQMDYPQYQARRNTACRTTTPSHITVDLMLNWWRL